MKADWNNWTQRFVTEQITWLQDQKLAWPDTVSSEIYILPEELKRMNLPQSDLGWSARSLYSPIYLYLGINRPSGYRDEILASGYLRNDGINVVPGGHDVVGPPRLTTLEDFRDFWNAADQVQAFIVTELAEVIYIVANGNVKGELRRQPEKQPRQGERPRLGSSLKFERRGIGRIEGEKCWEEVDKLSFASWGPKFNVFFCDKAPTDKKG